jgi:hypothetical protein
MRGQTNMILVLLVIIIFVGLILILLSLSQSVVDNEYSDLYVNNLLLSLLRTSTGHTDRCETISDTIACSFLTPSYRCGGSQESCMDLANQTLGRYTGMINENMRYYFIVKSADPGWIPLDESGPVRLEFGDSEVYNNKRITKRVASTVIQKVQSGNEYNIEVSAYITFSGNNA